MNELATLVNEAWSALERRLPIVLATVVAVRGSAYRRPGARMLVTSEGWRAGSISGGCLEADLVRQAAFLVSHGRPLVRSYDTSEEAGARLGCGGEIDVLLEPITEASFINVLGRVVENRETVTIRTAIEGRIGEREVLHDGVVVHSTLTGSLHGLRVFEEVISPSHKLVLVGAGHDALPVARMANELGWSVDVYDWRPGFASQMRFPSARVFVVPAQELKTRLQTEAGALAVVMAHHLDYDAAALDVLLRRDSVRSVGLLGPRHRSAQVVALLEARGGRLTDAQRARLRAPVGLDIGADGPAAIALSILSEVQAIRAERDGGSLSLKYAASDTATHG